MPLMDGIEATRAIIADSKTADARIIILTTFDLDEYVYEALRAGASGFLIKDTDPEALLDAIRVVAAGEALLAPSVTRRLIAEFARRPAQVRASLGELEHLTEREREVFQLVAHGLSNAEIATELYISPATAKTHVSRVMMKLGARDRAQLVTLAYESGFVTPLAFFIPGTFITMAQGIAMPYAQVGAMAEIPRFAGTAAGVGVFMQNFFAAVFAQLYGLLADGTPWPMSAMAVAGGVLCLLAGAVPFALARRRPAYREL
jgi:DNA-binding NarL/FixJ family response regulator